MTTAIAPSRLIDRAPPSPLGKDLPDVHYADGVCMAMIFPPQMFVLFVETSDQMDKSEPVGVYSSRERAEKAAARFKQHRTYMRSFAVDELPATVSIGGRTDGAADGVWIARLGNG